MFSVINTKTHQVSEERSIFFAVLRIKSDFRKQTQNGKYLVNKAFLNKIHTLFSCYFGPQNHHFPKSGTLLIGRTLCINYVFGKTKIFCLYILKFITPKQISLKFNLFVICRQTLKLCRWCFGYEIIYSRVFIKFSLIL